MGEPPLAGYDAFRQREFWKTLTVATVDTILISVAIAALMTTAGLILASAAPLRGTTLQMARRWSLAAVAVWSAAVVGELACAGPSEIPSLLWVATTLLSLCPPVAVLGARRPGVAAWNGFVLMPLLAVLGWPVLTHWATGTPLADLRLETPALIGYAVVLLMGTGNYMGTTYWSSACLYAVACCLLVAPLSAAAPAWVDARSARLAASSVLGLAAIVARLQRRNSTALPPTLDGLWVDYRNLYGIVWARRLQDRLNALAHQQDWPVRATPFGFDWNPRATPEQRCEAAAKLEQSLKWMLRRFVSTEWIDGRLGDR